MGRISSTQSNDTTPVPFQQKQISVYTTTGWSAGDYVYAGPGSTGYGYNLPTSVNIPIIYSVQQGVAVGTTSVSANPKPYLNGPVALNTYTYTGPSITPNTTSGLNQNIYSSTGYYPRIAAGNGGGYTVGFNIYPYHGWQTYDASGTYLGGYNWYDPSYYTSPRVSIAAMANGGYVTTAANSSGYAQLGITDSSGNLLYNINAPSGIGGSIPTGSACVGFANGNVGYFFTYSSTMYWYIYTSTQTLVTSGSITGITAGYGCCATALSNGNAAVFVPEGGSSSSVIYFFNPTSGLAGSTTCGYSYNGNTNSVANMCTLTNGDFVWVATYNDNSQIAYSVHSATGSLKYSGILPNSSGYGPYLGGVTYIPTGGFCVSTYSSSYPKNIRYDNTGAYLGTYTMNTNSTMTTSNPLYGGNACTLSNGNLVLTYLNGSQYTYITFQTTISTLTTGDQLTIPAGPFDPTHGYTLLGISTSTVAAGSSGNVITQGIAQLDASYTSVSTPVAFDYSNGGQGLGAYGNSGIVNGRTVSLKGF